MARFFGNHLDQKPVDRTILQWLTSLPNNFFVFVEVEGGDFQVDFLVIKQTGIFNVEAKHWHVRTASIDSDWELIGGKLLPSPVMQAREQSDRVAAYLLLQSDRFLDRDKSDAFREAKGDFKIFPVVALSHKRVPAALPVHPYFKIVTYPNALTMHLTRFEWQPKVPENRRVLRLEKREILGLVDLLRLEEVNSETLKPIVARPSVSRATSEPALAPAASPTQSVLFQAAAAAVTDSPYQYTYTVTGDAFYGRDRELERIKLALVSDPPRPVAIVGLQRTGKSSLALESIRRNVELNTGTSVLSFDFRRLWQEGLKQEEDVAKELLTQMKDHSDAPVAERVIEAYREAANKQEVIDQRRLFRKGLEEYRRRNSRVILFLDECQEIAGAIGDPRFGSFFSFLGSLCKDAALALRTIIVSRPTFFELDPIRQINLGRLFEIITIGPLDEASALPIVERGQNWLQFMPDAKKHILFLTGRHPFWLQFLCHKIFERWVFEKTSALSREFIEATFKEIVQDPGCRPQFYLLFQEVEKDEMAFALLRTVAEAIEGDGDGVLLSALPSPWQDKAAVRAALKPLVENQILSVENVPHAPLVKFRVEALRRWMRPNLITL
jgi:AAA+ ATPase superfamily predicted ATPase